MEAYIEYLNETEYSFNSEFDNYLKGGSNNVIDGGFPQFYECQQSDSEAQNSDARDKARSKTQFNTNSLKDVLDSRKKSPFMDVNENQNLVNRQLDEDDVDDEEIELEENGVVNSDSELQGGNMESKKFINLFENQSINLPDELSVISIENSISSIKNVINNKEMSEKNNLDIEDIFIKSKDVSTDINLDSVALPQNISIISIDQEGGENEQIEMTSESIMLPENINIIDIQLGGNEQIDVTSDSIMLPENIDIIEVPSFVQNGGYLEEIDVTSDSVTLPIDINVIDINNKVDIINDIDEFSTDSIELPEDISIIDFQNGGFEMSDTDSIMLPENIDVIDIQNGGNSALESIFGKNSYIESSNVINETDSIAFPESINVIDIQDGGFINQDISTETELELPSIIEVIDN